MAIFPGSSPNLEGINCLDLLLCHNHLFTKHNICAKFERNRWFELHNLLALNFSNKERKFSYRRYCISVLVSVFYLGQVAGTCPRNSNRFEFVGLAVSVLTGTKVYSLLLDFEAKMASSHEKIDLSPRCSCRTSPLVCVDLKQLLNSFIVKHRDLSVCRRSNDHDSLLNLVE